MSVSSGDGDGGEFVRTFQLASSGQGVPLPIGTFSDGTVLVRTSGASAMPPTGLSRDPVLLWRYLLDGELLDTVGIFEGDEMYRAGEGQRTIATSLPFGRRAMFALSGTHLFFGPGNSYHIDVFSSNGRLERSIRQLVANGPVTKQEIERIRRPPEDQSRPRPPGFQQLINRMPFPETKPAYGELVVDAASNLWVAEYSLRLFETTSWTVFDPQGTLLGTVQMPRGSRVRQIGHDYVLATWRGEDEVEHVRLYELVKPNR